MQRTVAFIIGTSYCGSSLLNLLFDALPGVRGLGEAVHLARPGGPAHCNLCRCSVQECALFGRVDPRRFYGSLFDIYGDSRVLVDSSKSLASCIGVRPLEPQFAYKGVLLSKAPHEFAWSWMGHHPEESPAGAFRRYVAYYTDELERRGLATGLSPWDWRTVTYRRLCRSPQEVVSELCELIDVPHAPRSEWWCTDTHVIGGNWMVAAQTQERRELFGGGTEYLRGKYAGRYRTIFYDDQWRGNAEFTRHCRELYEARGGELEPLLAELGQLDVAQQIEELTAGVEGREVETSGSREVSGGVVGRPWSVVSSPWASSQSSIVHPRVTTARAGLPGRVAIPPRTVVTDEPYQRECWQYLHDTIAALPIELRIDPALTQVCPGAFLMRIDGREVVFDYSDYLLVDGAHRRYGHWLRFHDTPGFRSQPNIGSFPPISFLDWNEYERLSRELTYDARGETILHSQSFAHLAGRSGARVCDLYSRRKAARDALMAAFGERVWTEREAQNAFWRRAAGCLVSVHIPGSWRHSLDRGQHQLLGLGVCTISPEIWTATLGERIEPGVHYVRIRDDYSDLVEQVVWCQAHRAESAAIGRRAQEFFRHHSTPQAIWRSIKARIEAG